jgi:carbonic anhydrase
MPPTSPITAWNALKEGNERFLAGETEHPSQRIDHRRGLAAAQHPTAVVLGCSDSRVAAEIIFDQGLGDMFVIRTAGQVIDAAVLGSVEFAVTELNVPLVVVLGHDSCGAVRATLAMLDDGASPTGYVLDIVERVVPSIVSGRGLGLTTADDLGGHHVNETIKHLRNRSAPVAERIAHGRLAIVGVTYHLSNGRIVLRDHVGDIGETIAAPV